MSMPSPVREWTIEEMERLPDDGNKYEVVHGELFVTPAPTQIHEIVAARLSNVLAPYVARHGLGLVFRPRSVIRFEGSEVEPDLMVRELPDPSNERWEDAPTPSLVVEIVSATTRRRDHVHKRALYAEVGIPEYWIFDAGARAARIVRAGREDLVATDLIEWAPLVGAQPLVIRLEEIFEWRSSAGEEG